MSERPSLRERLGLVRRGQPLPPALGPTRAEVARQKAQAAAEAKALAWAEREGQRRADAERRQQAQLAELLAEAQRPPGRWVMKRTPVRDRKTHEIEYVTEERVWLPWTSAELDAQAADEEARKRAEFEAMPTDLLQAMVETLEEPPPRIRLADLPDAEQWGAAWRLVLDAVERRLPEREVPAPVVPAALAKLTDAVRELFDSCPLDDEDVPDDAPLPPELAQLQEEAAIALAARDAAHMEAWRTFWSDPATPAKAAQLFGLGLACLLEEREAATGG
jgi:hypothetical protein